MNFSSFVAIGLLAISLPGYAVTVSEAKAATQRNDFDAAYPMWLDLAEKGDSTAIVEMGLMHHLGQGVPRNLDIALDWYLKVFPNNGDVLNNIGVMFRDGQGVPKNRKISFLLFLTVHMQGMGNEITVSRANRNLRREISELPLGERQEALCYTMQYLVAYVQARGKLEGIPEQLRYSPERKRIKDLDWWLQGEVEKYDCPSGT